MAKRQTPHTPHRRPVGDRARIDAATPSDGDPDPTHPHHDTPGHPNARGTLPMARHLTDPATEDEIQALAATAPPMTIDQAAHLARLLRLNKPRRDQAA